MSRSGKNTYECSTANTDAQNRIAIMWAEGATGVPDAAPSPTPPEREPPGRANGQSPSLGGHGQGLSGGAKLPAGNFAAYPGGGSRTLNRCRQRPHSTAMDAGRGVSAAAGAAAAGRRMPSGREN